MINLPSKLLQTTFRIFKQTKNNKIKENTMAIDYTNRLTVEGDQEQIDLFFKDVANFDFEVYPLIFYHEIKSPNITWCSRRCSFDRFVLDWSEQFPCLNFTITETNDCNLSEYQTIYIQNRKYAIEHMDEDAIEFHAIGKDLIKLTILDGN